MKKSILCLFLLIICFSNCSNEEILDSDVVQKETTALRFFGMKTENAIQTHGVAQKNKLWHNGTVIKVKFLHDPYELKNKIIQYAKEWEQYANIIFQFIENGDADVRIGFDWNNERYISWSYIGTDCKSLTNQDEATMSFAYFYDLSERDRRADVLRNFGLVLGLELEHRHINFYPGWTSRISQYWESEIEDIPWTTLKKYVFDPIESTNLVQTINYDENSIMAWPFMSRYASNTVRDFNYDLSEKDINFIKELYPKQNTVITKMIVNTQSISFHTIYNYASTIYVDWGDGNINTYNNTSGLWLQYYHNYTKSGTYTVKITGDPNALKGINIHRVSASYLDLSGSKGLINTRTSWTQMINIDFSKNPLLESISAANSQISYLDVTNNPRLSDIKLTNTPLVRNKIELVKFANTLPYATRSGCKIWIAESTSASWIRDICNGKNWEIVLSEGN